MTFTQAEQDKIKRFSEVENIIDQAVSYLGESNDSCQGAGYVVSGYFRSILEEPNANLGTPFSKYENQINTILGQLRWIATLYIYGHSSAIPPTPTHSDIIRVNLDVISYCNFYIAVLDVLQMPGMEFSTAETVEVINEISARAAQGQVAALALQARLNQHGSDLTTQSNSMRSVVDSLGNSVGVVSGEMDRYRDKLEDLDDQIEDKEQRISTKESEQGISSTKVVATAVLVRGIVRRIIRGVAFIRSVRETGGLLRELRDALANLHSRRADVYTSIAKREAALASAESYDDHIRIQGERTRQAVLYMSNMANSWGSQSAALEQLSDITVAENAGSFLLRVTLRYAETSINAVLTEARRIHQEMLNVPFYEEPVSTLPEVYLMGKSSARSTEWKYPNSEIEVIKRSLLEKYGKGQRSAE
jgi:hypothetical protein